MAYWEILPAQDGTGLDIPAFTPVAVLPEMTAQAGLSNPTKAIPELALVGAVLIQAILDVVRAHKPNDRRAVDAMGWIEARCREPWGFAWCCDILGLDADSVAHAVKANSAQVRTHIYRSARKGRR